MKNSEIKSLLIKAGISNLREFGYPDVNEEEILTDEVYGLFFDNMLKDNLGKSTTQVDEVINELIEQIKTNLDGRN